MSKFLFVLASTATLVIVSPAVAQYAFVRPGIGIGISPWYGASPWYGIGPWNSTWYSRWYSPWYTAPGYMWREQRVYIDPNAVQERQKYEQPRTLNNFGVTNPNAGPGECAIGSSEETCRRRESFGVTDPGECAIGFSEETCRRRGQKYNPPRQN
jgi:hypothetical protein